MSQQYKLVWSDEFEHDGAPDPAKWGYETGGHGWGNGESQFYTEEAENCFVKDGVLCLRALKKKHGDNDYTSAKITTRGKADWKYGKFEIRAKLPKGKGSWPAIWMMPCDRGEVPWPLCGEIDIMEHVGVGEDVIHVSLHTDLYNHRLNTQRTHFEPLPGATDGFHTYGMEWEDGAISFFYDGRMVQRWERGQDGTDASDRGWPFDKPYYLILNVAVGGFFGGEIDPESLPYTMEVESVKVYQKQ